MSDEQIIDEFRHASPVRRLEMVVDEAAIPALRSILGEEPLTEYQGLAASYRPDRVHLSAATPKNVVFVPGVMGSLLENRTKSGVWWIDARTVGHLNGLRLAPDGLADLDPDDRVKPFNVDVTYAPFLTAALRRDDIGVELFPYDWRKPLTADADRLRDLVVGMAKENGMQPVHLVAHSMGGLIVRTTLLRHGDELWPLIGRIVFVGTPHFGSTAIAGYLKNHLWGFEFMAVLGVLLKRATLRSMWGVLGMLPAPAGVYPGTRGAPAGGNGYAHPCLNFNPYQVDSWRLDLETVEAANLQTVLDGAAAAHRELWDAHRKLPQDKRERMLVIAGVGYRTLFRMAYREEFFGLWKYTDKISKRSPGDPHRDGDGRVPMASTALDWVPIRFVRGVHGRLMSIPSVQDDIFAFLTGGTLQLPTTPQGALGGHLGGGDRSRTPALDGSALTTASGEDPGLWTEEDISAERLAELVAEIERGRLPEFELVRLL